MDKRYSLSANDLLDLYTHKKMPHEFKPKSECSCECKWFVKISGKETKIQETPKKIEPLDLYLDGSTTDVSLIELKINELIQDRNDRVVNGEEKCK